MIQFNLLPDVKQEYVKARRTKRLVTLISLAASAAAVFVLLLMLLTVDVVQRKSLSDLNDDIGTYSSQLKAVPDLNKMLTVQNQLNTITALHDQKVVTSRLFTYISQVTPTPASINSMSVDFQASTITVNGEAPSLDVVNAYVDTLKSTVYTTEAGGQKTAAFSKVVLTSFGRSNQSATYSISLSFDPIIFNSADNPTLSVPSGTSAGAQAALFQKQVGN